MLSTALRPGVMHSIKTGAATAKALSLVILADLISDLARVLLPTDLTLYLDCLRDQRLLIYDVAMLFTALFSGGSLLSGGGLLACVAGV